MTSSAAASASFAIQIRVDRTRSVTRRSRGRPQRWCTGKRSARCGFPCKRQSTTRSARERAQDDPRLSRAAPAAAGVIAVALIALTAWLDIPVTRSLAIAALVIFASMLTTIRPLDGAAMAKAGAAGAGVAALALGALVWLGIG
jgi:hypothetical protein